MEFNADISQWPKTCEWLCVDIFVIQTLNAATWVKLVLFWTKSFVLCVLYKMSYLYCCPSCCPCGFAASCLHHWTKRSVFHHEQTLNSKKTTRKKKKWRSGLLWKATAPFPWTPTTIYWQLTLIYLMPKSGKSRSTVVSIRDGAKINDSRCFHYQSKR